MERIGLHGLRQPFDAEGRLPGRVAQPEGRLDAGDLAREEGGGDLGEALRALGRQAEARVRRHRDVAAHRFGFGDFHARQRPRGFAQRLVAFEAKLDQLPPGHRLAIDQPHGPQDAVGLVVRLEREVVGQARAGEPGDGVAFGHAQQQLAQGRLADVQLDLAVNRQLALAEVIRQHLRHAQLGQDLIRLDAQREVRARKAVGKPLAPGHPQRRAGGVALRELVGRNLRQPAGLHDLQPHRPFVHDAEVAGKARRALGPQLHHIRRLRERAQRRLHLHLEGELVLLRLVELDDEPAVGGVRDRLDVPREHLVALHPRDFARAAQQQRHAVQLALHDLEIQQRHLAHQARADADLRQHFRGVEQLAFGLGPGLFPGQLHRAVRRQVAE